MTKRGRLVLVLDMRVVILVGGGLVYEIFVRRSVYSEGCSEDFMYLFLFSIV